MIHIQPVPESDADEKVQKVYADIKAVLKLSSAPYYFQLLAAYPDFLNLLWTRLHPNLTDPCFFYIIDTLISLTRDHFKTLVPTDPRIDLLLPKIPGPEKSQMKEDFWRLQKTNAILLVINILVREAIKGLQLERIQALAAGQAPPAAITTSAKVTESDLTAQTSPLGFPEISSEAQFLAYMRLVSDLLAKFATTKDYLQIRVALENEAQKQIRLLPQTFTLPYGEVLNTIFNQPFADELVFLLHDAFPSYFPKQFLASLLLEISLSSQTYLSPLPDHNLAHSQTETSSE